MNTICGLFMLDKVSEENKYNYTSSLNFTWPSSFSDALQDHHMFTKQLVTQITYFVFIQELFKLKNAFLFASSAVDKFITF